jgi:NadR type nicotinamide-nucleotide adenylyltransferase
MQQLFPNARVLGYGAVVPQAPAEQADFWPIWREIVRSAHPEPIDIVFAGEAYGQELAAQLGARFLPLFARSGEGDPLAGLSGSKIRADPWKHWDLLPSPVRGHYARTICLHGPESVGKTTLALRLAAHFETIVAPEYGRSHCETFGTDLDEAGLITIGRVQTATIAAARRWCNRRLIADTDALMTAAWCEMLLGRVPSELLAQPKADLYLLLEPDVPFVEDGTRFFGTAARRARFGAISEKMLEGLPCVRIGGRDWEDRFGQAVAAIEALGRPLGPAATQG